MTTRTGACFGSTRAMKPASECRFDEVSLGEVMLRLDPGEGRIHTTRFRVYEGGGEYNVARGLRRRFGQRTIVTALADNPVGRLIEDLLLQAGVDLSYLRCVKLGLTNEQEDQIVAFLQTLTDGYTRPQQHTTRGR